MKRSDPLVFCLWAFSFEEFQVSLLNLSGCVWYPLFCETVFIVQDDMLFYSYFLSLVYKYISGCRKIKERSNILFHTSRITLFLPHWINSLKMLLFLNLFSSILFLISVVVTLIFFILAMILCKLYIFCSIFSLSSFLTLLSIILCSSSDEFLLCNWFQYISYFALRSQLYLYSKLFY